MPRQLAAAVLALAIFMLVQLALHGEIIDRIVAVVGNTAITQSEIDKELRLEALFNHSPVSEDPQSAQEVLRRLIDRRLIQQDLAMTPFLLAKTDEINQLFEQFRRKSNREDMDFNTALRHYGITEQDCQAYLAEQLNFESYVSFRFKTGLKADPQQVEAYYQVIYLRQQREAGTAFESLNSVSQAIQEILIEQQANELLEKHIMELQSETRVEILVVSRRQVPE